MFPCYFDYIFVHPKLKALPRPELSPKFLSTLARTRPEPDPKSPARLTTLPLTTRYSTKTLKKNEGKKHSHHISRIAKFLVPASHTINTEGTR